MTGALLSYLWPTSNSRWAKLYRGAVLAVVGALLTYLSQWVTQQDFGQLTPVVAAAWSLAANAVRQWAGHLAEADAGGKE